MIYKTGKRIHSIAYSIGKLLPLESVKELVEKSPNDIEMQILYYEKYIVEKDFDIKYLRLQMDKNFSEQIDKLKCEKYYSAFNYSSPENLLTNIKSDMRKEIESELSRENHELAKINQMIARINELELQSRR